MVAFVSSSALIGEPSFLAEDVVAGVRPNPTCRDQPGWIWVDVDTQVECLRVYGMPTDEHNSPPIIFFEGDVIDSGNRFTGNVVIRDHYALQTPFLMQAEAEQLATAWARSFLNLARPGVFGSSGDHNERRREREVALVDAALDQLKAALDWDRVDLAGLSGGGHLVAALMARRSDINHAVIASGNVAVRKRNQLRGRTTDATGYTDFVDPIDFVNEVSRHPPRRITVLTDPQDAVVPAACQDAYVRALQQAGVGVVQRYIAAMDERHHILRLPAIRAACAGG